MPWIRLPKSGIPMHINGHLREGMVEIPDPNAKPAEPSKEPKGQAKEPQK